MQKYKLSICIPTYNREKYIGETINSIIQASKGYEENIQITISDNASTDNTKKVVNSYKNIFPNITYFQQKENVEADRNYLNAIKIASGEYCWLMGSDDVITKDSIEYILKIIDNKNLSGITLNNYSYNIDLTKEIKQLFQFQNTNDITFYSDIKTCFLQIGLSFGYISAQIVKKELWDKVIKDFDVSKFYNAYVHSYIILKILTINPNWAYIHKKCLIWRGGNDSFAQSLGSLKRLMIDIHGYSDITKDIFGYDSPIYRSFTKILLNRIIKFHITFAKKNKLGLDFYIPALKECLKYYRTYPTFWFKVFPIFLMPSFLHAPLKKLYIFLFVKE